MISRKNSSTLAVPGRWWFGPSFTVNGDGVNGAEAVVDEEDLEASSTSLLSVPLSQDFDSCLFLVCQHHCGHHHGFLYCSVPLYHFQVGLAHAACLSHSVIGLSLLLPTVQALRHQVRTSCHLRPPIRTSHLPCLSLQAVQ